MKKSFLLASVFAGALTLSPIASAQTSWPTFRGNKEAAGLALKIDPERGVVTMAPLLEKTTPAVVTITVSKTVSIPDNPLVDDDLMERFFGEDTPGRDMLPERFTQGAGSGVIINAGKGYVLTNHHVVDGADKITVILKDGREADGELIGSDGPTDIALLKIDLPNLTDVTLANSDTVKVGDYVIAIGNPFGIGQTVTTGIVSALDRNTSRGDTYQNYIQTDAAINQGNSGGALLNSKGELIGINAAILSRSGGSNGIGFAVPINMVTGIMDQLIAYGEVHRGKIGVSIQDITPELMEAMNLSSRKGALVAAVVEASPADKAGLEPGDIIIEFNGEDILDSNDIRTAVGFVERGNKAKLVYMRAGKKRTVRIGVENTADEEIKVAETAEEPAEVSNFDAFSGASFSDIPADLDPSGGYAGVLVTKIKRGSDAWDAGLREDDIIRAVNNMEIENLDDFRDAIKGRKKAVALSVQRGRSRIFIAVK